MNKLTLLTLALATSALTASAQRNTINLKTWQFSRDSVNYKPVTIPHDGYQRTLRQEMGLAVCCHRAEW